MRSRYWFWALALFVVACGDTQTTRPDTSGDTSELVDQDVEPTDLGDFDGSDGSDESPNDQDAADGTDEGDDGVDPDGLDQEQPCPSDRLCGGGCCEAPSVCYLGQCRETCTTGVTCGESAGLCCPSGEGCRPDGSCGLVCEDERPTCGEGIWETCCATGEVCNNERCSKDCGENVLCGELCCSGGQMCYDGACVASCADPGQLCGAERELCCPNDEVCLGGTTCIEPGKPCQLTEECEIDEYCEPTLQACVPRTLVEVCEYRPPIGVFNPVRGCLWTAPDDARPPACGTSTDGLLSAMSDVVMTPTVANLTDDNGDGITDENDIPDIVFTSFNYAIHGCCDKGVIRIVDGRCNSDGSMNTIATLDQVWIDNSGGIALGNLDPASEVDERNPEIVAVFRLGGTIAYKRASSDGSAWVEMWRNSSYLNNTYTRGGTQPSLADLNGDGAPEVLIGNVVLNGQTGELIWDGKLTVGTTAGVGNNAFLGPMSTAADLDLDGLPEVIAGNTVYDGLSGAEKWTYTYTSTASSCGGSIPCDGYSAVGNFDPDPEGEVVIVRLGEVFVLEHNGALKHKVVLPKDDCGANESGPPTIADFDGDGRPEIGTAGADYYIVVDFDCVGDPLPEECHAPNIRWVAPNNDCSSRATGSSVFDFDGDGNAEVVYADERNFRVFDGKTGAVLLDDDTHRSNTRLEMPIVADVDNDGKAEVLVPNAGNPADYGGLEVWDDTDNNWVRTRRIWNQHTYHVSNISEDGQVPSYETPNWMSTRLNNFRQNVQPGGLFDAPDMVTDSIDVEYALCAQNNTVRIVVVVSNDGAVGVPAGIDVHAVVELSGSGEQIDLGVQQTNAPMLPGGQAQLVFEWVPASSIGWVDFTVHVSVDDDGEGNGQYNECHEENNDLSSAQFKTCEPS